MSIPRGLISGLARFWTITSSSLVLQTTKTMKPFLSRSRASDRVSGRAGEPATTTTSTRPPLRDRLARRFLRMDTLALYVRYTTVPVVRRMKPVKSLCLEIQFWNLSSAPTGMATIAGGGGGGGRSCSGTHSAVARTSLIVLATWST